MDDTNNVFLLTLQVRGVLRKLFYLLIVLFYRLKSSTDPTRLVLVSAPWNRMNPH